MTAADVLDILLGWATQNPAVGEALGKLVSGHPDARKVRAILPVKGTSERVADELKAEGES